MTFVVTGATGHLGRLVVEAMLTRGVAPDEIVATGRRVETLGDLAAAGVQVRRADYDDPASLDAAFADAERLLLVSGTEFGTRVGQHRNAIDAAVRAGVRHIAYTSGPRADTAPLPVNPDHWATEQLLQASGVTWTALRDNWYSEGYLPDVARSRETGEIASATGSGRVASASRRDFAEAAAVVLTTAGHENAVYELGGDVAWSYDELAQLLSSIVGRPVVHRHLTPAERRASLVAAGLPEGVAEFVTAIDTGIAAGALAEVTGTLSRLIGRPTTPLHDTLAPT